MSLASCVHLLEGMEPGVAGVDGDAGPAAGGRERGGHEANIVDDRPEAEPSGLAPLPEAGQRSARFQQLEAHPPEYVERHGGHLEEEGVRRELPARHPLEMHVTFELLC